MVIFHSYVSLPEGHQENHDFYLLFYLIIPYMMENKKIIHNI